MMSGKAEEMLKNYKAYLGRCSYIEAVIEGLKVSIKIAEADARDDLINGSGKQPDGMPHGTTMGNPTERIAIMLATGIMTDDIAAMNKEIAALEAEHREKSLVVYFVQAWLKGLSAKERWMIERCYFDEMTYREINARYREEYGENCSKDLLRRLKKDALAKIFEMAK